MHGLLEGHDASGVHAQGLVVLPGHAQARRLEHERRRTVIPALSAGRLVARRVEQRGNPLDRWKLKHWAAYAKGSRDGTLRLLSVGAVVPRKGFDVLIDALATIAGLPWRLTIAGSGPALDTAMARRFELPQVERVSGDWLSEAELENLIAEAYGEGVF